MCCNTGACVLTHSADDHSRVVLDLLGELPGSDYINATWVNVSERLLWAQHDLTQVCASAPPPSPLPQGYTEPRTYIACQGPLPNYIEDFWRMVWQFRIPTIVIVTNLMEGQKVCTHIVPQWVGLMCRSGWG